MSRIRPPAVAGTFYPDEPEPLRAEVRAFLSHPARISSPPPKAVIVPHAGYIYSGPVAGTAYAQLVPLRGQVRRVVLLGPAHRVPVRGLAAPTATHFRTPLGDVPVNQAAVVALAERLPQVVIRDDAHAWEHSLEVQLPFLQEVLEDFELVPLVVGDATYEEVREVLDAFWDDPETLIVISSDLSHYHDYATARAMDSATSKAIESLRPEALDYDDACGRIPVGGALLAARARGLRAETLDLRNSGDTAGPRDQVVGYGAYVIH